VAIAAIPLDVSTLTIGTPTTVCELDMRMLKGELRALSWSPDGDALHLRTVDDRIPQDYIVSLDDRELTVAFGEPEWAMTYWTRKSDLAAPGLPGLRLELTETNRRTRPVPFTGGFTNGGAQTPDVKNPVDAYEAEVTLRLNGVEIGNWINGAPRAGETFGWGPAGTGALVFVDRQGRLTFVDADRRRQTARGIRDASLPAWSDDGSRVAFAQKTGRRAYRLAMVDVRSRT
jgi:hypothetical protein